MKLNHLTTVITSLLIYSLISNIKAQQEQQNPQDDSSSTSSSSMSLPLWLSRHQLAQNETQQLSNLLSRIGPNMKASSDYHDFNDTSTDQALLAWQLLHRQSEHYSRDQVRVYRPRINELLVQSNVSSTCLESVKLTLDALERLEDWAVQMWGSTGNFPPVGLNDGHFTDLGSYRQCVDLQLNQSESDNNIKFTSHCTIALRPIVPRRPTYHMIIDKSPLLNIFEKSNDVFNRFSEKAHYFHYVYLKTGICVPYQCSPQDVQQVAGVVGARLALIPGPVKCFSRAHLSNVERINQESLEEADNNNNKSESYPLLVEINPPMNTKQLIAYYLLVSFFGLVILATTWHALELCLLRFAAGKDQEVLDPKDQESQVKKAVYTVVEYTGLKYIAINYFSIITNGQEFFSPTTNWRNEIKCLHGLRAGTMTWIICVHTFQYNDWSAFHRAYTVEPTLKNIALHPLYNANYVVDNFFLMSGLLAAYTTWYASKGGYLEFSILRSLIARYLRLTPQVLLISLLYMVLPLVGDGPFWYDMSNSASKYCQNNWWINLLHLQAFYKSDEICNLVSWWISVDMIYYILALFITLTVLKGHVKRAFISSLLLVLGCILITAYRHYTGGYPPNNLGTIPQVAEVWTSYVVYFFWSPFPHAFPFFLGLWNGYVLANNMWRTEVRKWSRTGWTLSTVCLIAVNLSSHIWMSGSVQLGPQFISTIYNNLCVIVWALAFSWVITACHYGCAPTLNKFLSNEVFVLGSKASFIIYLSHMLVVRSFFGLQNFPLELSVFNLVYIVVGNIFTSTIFGLFLAIAFEGPCMKFQKYVVDKLKSRRRKLSIDDDSPPLKSANQHINLTTTNKVLLK